MTYLDEERVIFRGEFGARGGCFSLWGKRLLTRCSEGKTPAGAVQKRKPSCEGFLRFAWVKRRLLYVLAYDLGKIEH
jgi:hypothetical protein